MTGTILVTFAILAVWLFFLSWAVQKLASAVGDCLKLLKVVTLLLNAESEAEMDQIMAAAPTVGGRQ